MDTEQRIRDFILQELAFDQPDLELEGDTPLIKTGIVDSLGIVRLIGYLDEEFGVKVAADEMVLSNFETVGAIRRLVDKHSPE